jgi:hypothetical protein
MCGRVANSGPREVRLSRAPLRLHEKHVYEQGISLLRQMGWAVYRLSQPRASRQTLGLADVYAMHDRRGPLWWEAKREGGKQSARQKAFQNQCIACGVPYVLGGIPELAHWLRSGEILPWPRC